MGGRCQKNRLRGRFRDSESSMLHLHVHNYPTNIGIVRGTVSVATIVVVNAGVEIWLL